MSMSRLIAASLVGLAAAPVIATADPKFEFGKAEEVEKVKDVEYNASAEAGVVFTTGNSETTTATGGFKAARKTGRNKFSVDGNVTYARAALRVIEDRNGNGQIDNEDEIRTTRQVTAETFAGRIRYDRFLTKYNSLFIAALGSRDLPAGKERVLGAQAGYSRRLYKSDTVESVAEIGYDFAFEDLVAGDGVAIHSLRAFVGLKAALTDGTTFDASSEVLSNLNELDLPTRTEPVELGRDTRVNLKAAVSAKLGKNTAFSTSFEARFDNRPAPLKIDNLAMGFVPEASKLDTVMKASLIYTFF